MINNLLIHSLLSFFILIFVSKISYKFKLLDFPNKRKIHNKPTANTGGLALSLIYVFSVFYFNISNEELNLILTISFLISIVGFVDDKYHLNVGGKLSLQVIPIIYLIVLENLNLITIGDYNYFKLELNSFTIPFTLLAVCFLINSFNYFDGTDGTLGFTVITVLSILFFLSESENFQLFLIVLNIPLCFFLIFNFSVLKLPKLFLGDSGSLLLGFIIAFTLIYMANEKIAHPILLAFSISIFAYEFLTINLIRLLNNQNLFKAGQDHLHHFLLVKTKSIFFTNILISLLNIMFFIIGYLSFLLVGSILALILFVILFFIFFYLRNKYYKKL
tara:strand:- start:9071 stop:10066 length:996 start_codon:yes stop_codon:yes gene_type:complete